MRQRLIIGISALAVLAMCAFIFYMSSLVADDSDARSMTIAHLLAPLVTPGFDTLAAPQQTAALDAIDTFVRKAAHFCEFALLGLLVANLCMQVACRGTGARRVTARMALIAWALSVVYAASDEIHQLFVPGRAGMLMDVGIDACGALLGVLVFAAVVSLVSRKTRRRSSI